MFLSICKRVMLLEMDVYHFLIFFLKYITENYQLKENIAKNKLQSGPKSLILKF